LDKVKGYATPDELTAFGEKGGELFQTETIGFKKVDEYLKANEAHLLDVRKKSEFEEGHIPNAQNIAHTRLLERMEEVPTDKPVMVSCRSGARSAVASALLERADFAVKYVDDNIEKWLARRK
jgi:hydroxyacylglutathione hydrolase